MYTCEYFVILTYILTLFILVLLEFGSKYQFIDNFVFPHSRVYNTEYYLSSVSGEVQKISLFNFLSVIYLMVIT